MNRLHKHVEGEVEMTASQIRAAEILLKKSLPDLQSTDITTNGDTLSFSFKVLNGKR